MSSFILDGRILNPKIIYITLEGTVVTPNEDDDDDNNDNVGLIVGVTIGAIAVCAIVVVLIVWGIKRKKQLDHIQLDQVLMACN